MVVMTAAVEGDVDEAVVRRLLKEKGVSLEHVYGKRGKRDLLKHIQGYNNAARRAPWLVLVDLDQDAECAPPMRKRHLPQPAPLMCFRVAVRAVEAWLLADRRSVRDFFQVPLDRVPLHPESLRDPKQELVNLARRSRSAAVRQDMTPRQGSGARVGPAYASRLVEFVERHWSPLVAAKACDSLARALGAIDALAARTGG